MFKAVQDKLFFNFSTATALVFLVFGSVYLIEGKYILGVFETLLGGVQILNIAFLYYKKYQKISYRILVGSVHVMSLIIFVTGGLGNTGFLWIEFIPILTMLILSHNESYGWIAVYSGILLSLILYNLFIHTILVYTGLQIIQCVVVYILFLYLTGNNEKLKAIARDQLKAQNDELKQLSQTDCLTNLYNRSYINQILANEYNRYERYNLGFSLIMLDIDHFKKINDTFGHQKGDRVLVGIG